MVVSHHAKFQLITMTGSRFFWTVFVEILRTPLLALVPEAGLQISGSDGRGSPQTKSVFIRLLANSLYCLAFFFNFACVNLKAVIA